MQRNKWIYPLKRRRLPGSAGNKACNLQKLIKLKVQIPKTFICDWGAFQAYQADPSRVIKHLAKLLEKYINPNIVYAVRSSTSIEDGAVHSYAGQFESILNVKGSAQVLQALQDVWASACSENVKSYQQRHQIPDQDVRMGVIIQEMVKPYYSGVALSKNPVTGSDEVVIEAVQGEGTLLMQDGIKPSRWINKWGYWIEKDDSMGVPMSILEQIINQINDVSDKLGYPVDMEWVFDGEELYWVQVREITSLNKLNIYSNHLSKEMMPGMLKPLSFSIGAQLMSSAMLTWLGEIIGDLGIETGGLVKTFYYRAYFNMGAIGKIFKRFGFPAESMEMLLGALPTQVKKPKIKPTFKTFLRFPSIILYLLKNFRLRKKIRVKIDQLEKDLESIRLSDLDKLSPKELFAKFNDHEKTARELAYFASLSMFFLAMFNRALTKLLERQNIEISNFDVTENMPELENYYPQLLIEQLHGIYQSYQSDKQEIISSAHFEDLKQVDGIDEFLNNFEILINRFGYLGDSGNDFSKPPWQETPDALVKLITEFQVKNSEQSKKLTLSDLKERNQASPMLVYAYRRARDYQFLREKASNLYTKSKVIFRYYSLSMGKHFVTKGLIHEVEDIFYLTPDQLEKIIQGQLTAEEVLEIVETHKQEMARCQDKELPTVIYGETPPPVCHEHTKIFFGVPASVGSYTGRACVIKCLEDFPKLKKGEVLIIPYSDVTWAPLFAQAGALISASGGLLSHGSIVAREYGIPAIVSVDNALSIPDGHSVTVDAHKGVVYVHETI
jgi:pyruvate,water dikinase